MAEIFFKSYCWSIGTTSYRTRQMNLSIEKQLALMDEFRSLPDNIDKPWQELQMKYYDFLHDNNFLEGNASRPEKDAREKTSGLVNIGLLTSNRMLSESGRTLLEMCQQNLFTSDNILEISSDSYLYLKQLLKTSVTVDGKIVRPFIILIYLISKFGYLSQAEFTYFLPMCIDANSTNRVIESIQEYRTGNLDIATALYDVIKEMDNYKAALQLFLSTEKISPELICMIGFNRKSSKSTKAYDTVFYSIYNCLIDIYINKKNETLQLFQLISTIKGNTKLKWKTYFFGKNHLSNIKKLGLRSLTKNSFSLCKNVEDIKNSFFMTLHSFKVQATLLDYADLNKRYFKLSDCVLFKDSKVEFDIVPKIFFNLVAKDLYQSAYVCSEFLIENVNIEQISPLFSIAQHELYSELSKTLGVTIKDRTNAKSFVYNERYARFNKMVIDKFSNKDIVTLLDNFEKRDDNRISSYITDNADIPTLFEYVLGIAWYRISEMSGDILSFMNLSLDADLLPKTHAGGGMADIVYKYDNCSAYPKHTILIEATLSEKIGQRSMEIEPVTRHLGEYLSSNNGLAYSLFVPTYLNPNIVTDFRMRKNYPYLANNNTYVEGLKIIPLQTSELKIILQKEIVYSSLYNLFEKAYQSDIDVKEWYKSAIVSSL